MLVRNCSLLGELELNGINPAPKGTTQIDVEFDLTSYEKLQVTVKDLSSGKENRVSISSIDTSLLQKDHENGRCPVLLK